MAEKQKFNFLANANLKQPATPAETVSQPVAAPETGSTVSRQIQRLEQEPEETFTRFILRSRLRTNRKNNFEMVDIIESGHRRTLALDNLIEKWDGYDGEPDSPGYDDYLLYLKNVAPYKKGYPCKISGTIGENITLKEGSNYSRLSEEEQHTILSMLRAGEKVSASEIDTLLKEKKNLSEKIEEQCRTIRMLEAAADDSGNETGLAEKDTEIASLKREIVKLKEKEKKLTKKQSFNPNQALLAKQDLTVRNAYGTCRKDIRYLLLEMDSLRKLTEDSVPDEISALGILSENDMLDFIGELKNLLGGDMNETDS